MNDEKKKVKQAVALEYDPSDEAPRVIASGKGILAEKISVTVGWKHYFCPISY